MRCRYYDPIVKKNSDNILNVTAIVLANLCVSYIMTDKCICWRQKFFSGTKNILRCST